MRELNGYVLPSVLIISTVMLLGVSGIFILWENADTLTAGSVSRTQHLLNIESALTVYCCDSAVIRRISEDHILKLYEDREDAGVKIEVEPIGLYELVTLSCVREKERYIVGLEKVWTDTATLYVSDDGRPLSLAGNTNIRGKVYVPEPGINYTQVRAQYFAGEKMNTGKIAASGKALPDVRPEIAGRVRDILSLHTPLQEWLYVDKSMRLEDTILAARSIEIEDGFCGSVQLYATDTVIVGCGVQLKYPSGIFLTGDNPNRLVAIYGNTTINGYVVVGKCETMQEDFRANYVQYPGSIVRGCVYVDGIVEAEGIISGILLADKCFVFTDEGRYNATICGLQIIPNRHMAAPFLLSESGSRRRPVKKLRLNARRELPGSTLVEVIVSSLIMLLVFVLTMEVLSEISIHRVPVTDFIAAENAMKAELLKHHEPGISGCAFEWGELSVMTKNYSPGLLQTDVRATLVKNGKTLSLRKISEL